MKLLSVLGYALMGAGAVALFETHALFSRMPVAIGVQVVAAALMVWARLTFGMRSFHATANATTGGLVTTGPYRFIRHPIYTAIVVFVLGGLVGNPSWTAGGFVLLVLVGALTRMLLEERFLVKRYPEYAAYAARTKRMVPYVV